MTQLPDTNSVYVEKDKLADLVIVARWVVLRCRFRLVGYQRGGFGMTKPDYKNGNSSSNEKSDAEIMVVCTEKYATTQSDKHTRLEH